MSNSQTIAELDDNNINDETQTTEGIQNSENNLNTENNQDNENQNLSQAIIDSVNQTPN